MRKYSDRAIKLICETKIIDIDNTRFTVIFSLGNNPFFSFIPKTTKDLDIVDKDKDKFGKEAESYVKKHIKGKWKYNATHDAAGLTIEVSKSSLEETILDSLG